VVEWEEGQVLIILCIGCCWLCSGRVGRVTVFGLIFGLNIAGCVGVTWVKKKVLF
jgi:hypothetical protein